MLHPRSVVLGSMVVVAFLVGTVYGSHLPRVGAAVVAKCPNQPSAAQGYKATFQGVTVQILKFSINPMAEGGNHPKSGNSFYVAHVLITNNGLVNYRYDDYDLVLQAPDGTIYHRPGAGWLNTLLGFGTLRPGGKVAGDVVYEAPAKQHYVMLWDIGQTLPPLQITLPPLQS